MIEVIGNKKTGITNVLPVSDPDTKRRLEESSSQCPSYCDCPYCMELNGMLEDEGVESTDLYRA